MSQAELYDRITESYERTSSVKKTAEELGTSVIKVRRVLITENLWSSSTSEKIRALWEAGLSTKEIAEQLHYSEKNVQAFLPYTKGVYGREDRSHYSISSKEYRERNQRVAAQLVGVNEERTKDFVRSEDPKKEPTYNFENRPVALKLHLELSLDNCSEQDIEVLRKYGKMQNAISRDIIVPADMTLHSLHYAIQKLFGWQNEHLHHYEFPEEIFNELTQGSLAKWCSLAGIYFRFPEAESDNQYWDDDYEPTVSVKTWLRRKYRGPYFYGGLGDHYYENQGRVLQLKRELPTFKVRPSFQEYLKNKGRSLVDNLKVVSFSDATIEEFRNSVDLGDDITHLLERLTLMEYLYLPDNDYHLEFIDEKIKFLEDGLDESLRLWEMCKQNIDEKYDVFCLLAALPTVRMQAKSDRITYFYDYGDGWEVTIKITEAYYEDKLDSPEGEIAREVWTSYLPVCVDADGLSVLDDVGGVGGYIDFLLTMHRSNDEADRDRARSWARSLGWTGRAIKPKNML